jgi:hypothetical protein
MTPSRTASTLLDELVSDGAVLIMANGKLAIDAPPGVLTGDRTDAIRNNVAGLRDLVAARWRSREQCVAKHPCRLMSRCAEPVYGRPCAVPTTCCVCGTPLPHDRRMLCEICSGEFTSNRPQSLRGGSS